MDGSRAATACSVGPRDDGERVRLRVADKGGTDGGRSNGTRSTKINIGRKRKNLGGIVSWLRR